MLFASLRKLSSLRVYVSNSSMIWSGLIWFLYASASFFAMYRRMSMSSSKVSWTPGRWTLMTTASPLRRRALYTWAMLALPRGFLSICLKICVTGLPSSCSMMGWMCVKGTAVTWSSNLLNAVQYSGGTKSGRTLNSCASLMYAPPNSSNAAARRPARSSGSASWMRCLSRTWRRHASPASLRMDPRPCL